MKKALSILLSLVVLLAALPFTALPAFASRDDDWAYSVENGEAIIDRYEGTDHDVLVPVTLGGYPVTGIESCAFAYSRSLESVTLANNIQQIPHHVFMNCAALRRIIFLNPTAEIEPDAVVSCSSFLKIYGYEESTAETYANANSIDFVAFEDTFGYTTGGNPGGYLGIEATVKNYDDVLPYVPIPSTLDGCYVTEIADFAFNGCHFSRISIPDDVSSIGEYAFYECYSLSSIAIPDEVSRIREHTFTRCTSLTSVKMGRYVTGIGDSAFAGCSSLSSITIPEHVTSIGSDAFANCNSSLVLYGAAGSCAQTYANANAIPFVAFEDIFTYTVANNEATVTGYSGTDTNLYIPETLGGYPVTRIGPSAFCNCTSQTSIDLPDNLRIIGESAFQGCTRVTSLYMGSCVTTLGAACFADLWSLEKLKIGSSVQTIGDDAFRGLTSAKTLVFSPSVLSVGANAFYGCKLTAVRITDLDSWCRIVFDNGGYSNPLEVAHNLYVRGNLATDLVLSNDVTRINDCAFRGCTSITSVTVPDSVTNIGASAFRDCFSLSVVKIGNHVTGIGDEAFSGCSRLSSITIPDSVTSIGADVLAGYGLLSHYYCYKGSAADTYAANNYLSVVEHYFGDVNGDTDLTALDFSAAVNASLDETNLTNEVARTVADLNFDGVIDALDCRLVKLLSQGKEIPV